MDSDDHFSDMFQINIMDFLHIYTLLITIL